MSFDSENIASDTQKLAVGDIVTLYELDLTDVGSSQILYFTESIDDDLTPVIFDTVTYYPIHLDSDGWEVTGQETLPRPKLRVSNVLITFVSHINTFNDMIGAKLTRRRTLKKYLDGEPEADAEAQFAPDIFRVRQKTQQTKVAVEFELAPYMDFEDTSIPKRQILRDFCTWIYRQYDSGTGTFNEFDILDYNHVITCPYTGDYYYNRIGERVTNPRDDKCGKRITDCEMRFAGLNAGRNIRDPITNRITWPVSNPPVVTISDNPPGGPVDGNDWLDTGDVPNIWYRYKDGDWLELTPQPLPTSAFPSVARFQV